MEISSTAQTFVFLAALCFGAALGAVYDVFRIIRIAVPCGRAAVFVQDVLFWLLCAVSSFLFLLCVNTGVVRAFVLLGELLGATLYYFTLGVLVMRSARWIVGFFRRALRALGALLLCPLRALGRLTLAAARAAKKPCKDVRTHLQSRFRVVYNQYNHHNHRKGAAARGKKRRRKKRGKRKGSKAHEKAP